MYERECYREDIDTVECVECGKAHLWCSEGLLDGMALGAIREAERRLSSEGVETLRMIGQAGEEMPGGINEAWELAEKENIGRLSPYDVEVLHIFAARITLVEQAREELNEYNFARE